MTTLLQRLADVFRRLFDTADRVQQSHVWLSFPVAVVRKLSNDQGGSLGGLIAYYGFLAVFPLLLVFAAILGFVLGGDASLKTQVLHTTESSFPALSGYIDKAVSGSSAALGLGLAGAFWAGLGVTRATERAMNNIWDIPLSERPNLWWSRLRGFGMLCILGTTFLVSTGVASLRGSGVLGPGGDVIGVVGPLALNLVLYLLAFQILTNRHVAWSTLLPGAIFGATGWTALQSLGAFYVRHEVAHASHLYGSLAAVVGLLAWIYLGAQLTMYAAEINVVLHYHLWPRSLTGRVSTPADQRALARQAREAARSRDEVIAVAFDGPEAGGAASGPNGALAVPAEKLTAEALATHEAVAKCVNHLGALDHFRQWVEATDDRSQRQALTEDLRAETMQVATALGQLAREESELASALDQQLHRCPGG